MIAEIKSELKDMKTDENSTKVNEMNEQPVKERSNNSLAVILKTDETSVSHDTIDTETESDKPKQKTEEAQSEVEEDETIDTVPGSAGSTYFFILKITNRKLNIEILCSLKRYPNYL